MSKVVTLQQINNNNSDEEETIAFKRKDLEAERSNIRTIIIQQKQTIMKTVAEREAESFKRRAVEDAFKKQKEETEKQKKLNELFKNELDVYKNKVSSARQKCDISKDFSISEDEIKNGAEDYYNKKLKKEVDDYIKSLSS
jgi:hypothetical protein